MPIIEMLLMTNKKPSPYRPNVFLKVAQQISLNSEPFIEIRKVFSDFSHINTIKITHI